MENIKLELLSNQDDLKGNTTREKVKNTLTEELFFGICSPIGSMRDEVILVLKRILIEKYNYTVEEIKLSKYIERYKINELGNEIGKTPAYSNLRYKINEGNEIRRKYNNNSILVELAIKDIFHQRIVDTGNFNVDALPQPDEYKSRRKCFIFNSIKNREELLLLRQIYTDNFYQFSVFSPHKEREEMLIEKNLSKEEVEEIINVDEYENDNSGQNVRDTFTEADFFLRVSRKNIHNLTLRIERYLNLIFEGGIVTPTIEETAMYAAKSASGNSACLSRQVGASIISENGEILSTGWNDVPKFGGNLYREGDGLDHRCFNTGYCSNDFQKDGLARSIVDVIKMDASLNNIFKKEDGTFDIAKLSAFEGRIRNSRIKDLIEFSRSVHAEMHAIISGSQISGTKMIDGKLFSTTYPCHNCARHIIVAGIKVVYYIEPYKKSLGITLHDDALTEDEDVDDKVKILIFDGVAPRKYLSFFTTFTARKEKGKVQQYDYATIKPKAAKSLQALPTLEQQAIHSLKECGILE